MSTPGYEATIPYDTFTTGQSVAPGTQWESRTGEVKVTVLAFNSVAVFFKFDWDSPTTVDVVCWDVQRFCAVFHQVD